MNCQTIQKKILMAQSGELTGPQLDELRAHIDNCPECGAYEKDLDLVTATARRSLPGGEPSLNSLARIRGEAGNKPRIIAFPGSWIQVLAYAAALVMVVAGAYLVIGPGQTRGLEQPSGMSDMHAILACLDQTTPDASTETEAKDDSGLSDMARWLLDVEGLAEDQHIGTDVLKGFEEPLSTNLQSRRTHGKTGKKYV